MPKCSCFHIHFGLRSLGVCMASKSCRNRVKPWRSNAFIRHPWIIYSECISRGQLLVSISQWFCGVFKVNSHSSLLPHSFFYQLTTQLPLYPWHSKMKLSVAWLPLLLSHIPSPPWLKPHNFPPIFFPRSVKIDGSPLQGQSTHLFGRKPPNQGPFTSCLHSHVQAQAFSLATTLLSPLSCLSECDLSTPRHGKGSALQPHLSSSMLSVATPSSAHKKTERERERESAHNRGSSPEIRKSGNHLILLTALGLRWTWQWP